MQSFKAELVLPKAPPQGGLQCSKQRQEQA
jgi:hypothetical protein